MGQILISRIYAMVMIVSYTTASVSFTKWVLDPDFENNLDTSQLLWGKDRISLLTCCSQCNLDPYCRSFFYHPSLKTCLGSQSYKRGLPSGQSMQQGWKYYTKAAKCDGDYTFNKTLGLCYKIHPETKPYLEAMDACEAEEAKLIIIRNEMEFSLVQGAVKAAAGSLTTPFIGLRKTISNENIIWKWWNGIEAFYLNWAPGQPDNYKGTENCIDFHSNASQYNDDGCWRNHSFICQKKI